MSHLLCLRDEHYWIIPVIIFSNYFVEVMKLSCLTILMEAGIKIIAEKLTDGGGYFLY